MKLKTGLTIAVILSLFLLAGIVQAAECEPGWVIAYYPNQQWSGSPVITDNSVNIHFADPLAANHQSEYSLPVQWWMSDIANWPFGIIGRLQDYSLTATGSVYIDTPGDYTFATASDDEIQVFVDGTRIIDNEPDHGPAWNTGTITLTKGYHLVVLKYRENITDGTADKSSLNNVATISLWSVDAAGNPPQLVSGCHMTGPNAPEFPSVFVPAVFVIGMLGIVFMARRRE